MHPFKVYNSGVLSMFTRLYKLSTNSRNFRHPKKKLCIISSPSLLSPTPTRATTDSKYAIVSSIFYFTEICGPCNLVR